MHNYNHLFFNLTGTADVLIKANDLCLPQSLFSRWTVFCIFLFCWRNHSSSHFSGSPVRTSTISAAVYSHPQKSIIVQLACIKPSTIEAEILEQAGTIVLKCCVLQAIPENRDMKKMKFSFFPSKTSIVDKFWHFCGHLYSDYLFAKTGPHAIIFWGKKLYFHFLKSPIFGYYPSSTSAFVQRWTAMGMQHACGADLTSCPFIEGSLSEIPHQKGWGTKG